MTTKLLPGAALLMALAACSKPATPATSMDSAAAAIATMSVSPAVATVAATISKAIDAAPAKADSILAANQYTAKAFEDLLYAIAADSAASAAYAAAMK